MIPHSSSIDLPLWQDDPNPSFVAKPQTKTTTGFGLFFILLIFIPLIGTMLTAFYSISPMLFWIAVIFSGISIGFGYYIRRQKKSLALRVSEIQKRAKDYTKASHIGSAIHVAGHPLLERKQPVVLALIHMSEIFFYSYDSNNSITSIPIENIKSIQTVVYDDERIPHIGVVDSTAQALQIVFNHKDNEYVTLFRSMKKIRAIDWYHILQKSRMSSPN
jgi:hypothetical protein